MANYKLDNLYTKEEYMSKKGLTPSELKDKLEAGEIDIVSINGGALIKEGDFDLERSYQISESVNKILSLKKVNVLWIEDKIKEVIQELEELTTKQITDVNTMKRVAERFQYQADLTDALLLSKYSSEYKAYETKGKPTDYITFLEENAFNF